MTLTGMKKHVRILEGAGLVATRKVGRVRRCSLGPRKLEDETAWLADYRRMWEARLDRFGKTLARRQWASSSSRDETRARTRKEGPQ